MPQSHYPILGAERQIYIHLLTNVNRGDNTFSRNQQVAYILNFFTKQY